MNNASEVIEAVSAIRGLGTKSQIIVENHVPGVDVRVSVVGDAVIGASLRTAAYVIGDGNSTISQLVDTKNMQRKVNPHLALNLIQKDSIAENYLQRQSLNWNTVITDGQIAKLSGPANISAGGVYICERIKPVCRIGASYLPWPWRTAGRPYCNHRFLFPWNPETSGQSQLDLRIG